MRFILALLIALPAFAQIEGRWLSEEKNGEIEIYKEGDKWYGKLVRAKKNPETNNLDVHNPDESKRGQLVVGQVIVMGLEADGKNEWSGGKIYDPKSGKTYKSKAELDGNKLKLRGYIGVSLFGRTSTWTRITDPSQGMQGEFLDAPVAAPATPVTTP